MHYRTFGSLDYQPSALGFGAMRLPLLPAGPDGKVSAGRIDEPQATAMLHHAIDQGVNYVDTAYVYHEGASEGWLGRALKGGYREKVKVATKLPIWKAKTVDDFDRLLDEQLARLDLPGVDFYLLHSLEASNWPQARDLGVLSWAEKALSEGRIGHLGFSFHDEFDLFAEIIAATDLWSFCQIQWNYMDEEKQAGTRGLELAAGKGLAVIVMEPLRGGQLARTPPPMVQAIWDAAAADGIGAPQRTPVEWALRWIWDRPEVSLLLSGMSTMEQVEQNVSYADRSGVGVLGEDEFAVIARARDAYRELVPIPCTSCNYCMPCPSGVKIPDIFAIYNDAEIYGHRDLARMYYGWLEPGERADQCTECGECEAACPQKIGVIEWLERAQAYFNVGEK
jgi:predicted aldo/keto reductase-like oxidoreductase